ncbi:hypothetical protein PGB90_006216 [Kerria lacca]
MKFFVVILTFGLLYNVSCLPITEQSTGTNGSVATVLVDSKIEQKLETQSTPLAVEEKLAENSTLKESSSEVPALTLSPTKEEQNLDAPKQSIQSSSISSENQSQKVPETNSNNNIPAPEEHGKSESVIIPQSQPTEILEKFENKVEQASVSSEQPKESNNQVNAVSVDEPKPVQNEVKSEIPKEEVKSVQPQEEVKSEKLEDQKDNEEKPVENSSEVKSNEEKVNSEEYKKSSSPSSSEEKLDSVEHDLPKEIEKKEQTDVIKSEQKKEEEVTKPEDTKLGKNPEPIKKEEGSLKPLVESQSTESLKQSSPTVAVSVTPSEKPVDKLEQEKDVIKRETAKKDKKPERDHMRWTTP